MAQEDRHREAVKAYTAAQKKGDTKDPEDIAFWKGISLMQLERWDAATRAFRDAAKLGDKKMKRQTRQYIRYIAGEKRRQRELKKMLEGVGE